MTIILGLSLSGCQEPPTARFNDAKGNLEKAMKVGALRYSETGYREAERIFKAGWMEMAHQNGKLAPLRNYHKADSLLSIASQRALETMAQTQTIIRDLDSLARFELEWLSGELSQWRNSLDGSLVIFEAEQNWSRAELYARTSEQLIGQGEYNAARDELTKARNALMRLAEIISEYGDDAAQKIGVWRRWVRETLDESKTRSCHALIVDKYIHKAYLIKDGGIIKTYGCELGWNSALQKLFAGDGATPEGRYYVTQIKGNGFSKFYKALMINYPNENDRRRFTQNKAKGIISSRAKIGRLIEIHGTGGKREDWTDGCVALTNGAMDDIMKIAFIGMPVTIVRKSDRWP